eukprot:395905-Rhodomonas_salina.1
MEGWSGGVPRGRASDGDGALLRSTSDATEGGTRTEGRGWLTWSTEGCLSATRASFSNSIIYTRTCQGTPMVRARPQHHPRTKHETEPGSGNADEQGKQGEAQQDKTRQHGEEGMDTEVLAVAWKGLVEGSAPA